MGISFRLVLHLLYNSLDTKYLPSFLFPMPDNRGNVSYVNISEVKGHLVSCDFKKKERKNLQEYRSGCFESDVCKFTGKLHWWVSSRVVSKRMHDRNKLKTQESEHLNMRTNKRMTNYDSHISQVTGLSGWWWLKYHLHKHKGALVLIFFTFFFFCKEMMYLHWMHLNMQHWPTWESTTSSACPAQKWHQLAKSISWIKIHSGN